MKLNKTFLLVIGICCFFASKAQSYTLGWQGNEIISKNIFLNKTYWNLGYSSGDNIYATTDSEAINLHWKFSGGNRNKWIVYYIRLQNPVSISDSDIIGIDVKGSVCNINRDFSLKFEDGTNQSVFTWHGLASVNRWCNRLSILRSQLVGNPDWKNIKVITLVISSNASSTDILPDSGIVSVRNLQRSAIQTWQRAKSFENLKSSTVLDSVKNKALQGILNRQVPNGLFYTWKEDNSSWLYGHGLVLKILSLEGIWQNKIPSNSSAKAAEKLALFLINHQDKVGYWPRAWNTDVGSIKMIDENIWMGDFPWIITGLVNYYQKSGDERVLPSIQKAKSFLYSLIEPTGKFYTYNTSTGGTVLVSNAESYCAAINSVFELGDSAKATTMFNYISSSTWDNNLLYWKEDIFSTRPTLFSSTWMSMLSYHTNDSLKAINTLSFVGKVLDTHGPGKPEGFDGIGPVATWFEGTLTYICAGGPKSQALYDSIVNYRLKDGTIPAYNDSLGGKADIWAVNWSSLDATAWLYFAAAKISPFKQYLHGLIPTGLDQICDNSVLLFPIPANDKLYLNFRNNVGHLKTISVYDLAGTCLIKLNANINLNEIDVSTLRNGIYIVNIELDNIRIYRKIEIVK